MVPEQELTPLPPDPLDVIQEALDGDLRAAYRVMAALAAANFAILDVDRRSVRRNVDVLAHAVARSASVLDGPDGGREDALLDVDYAQVLRDLRLGGVVLAAVPIRRGDVIALSDGVLLRTHPPDRCQGQHCSVHNPSDHPLRAAPLRWREDRQMMERVCPHGIGHPDPDHIEMARDLAGPLAEIQSVHLCDGCCTERSE